MSELDPVLMGIVNRTMKESAIAHATEKGANSTVIESLEKIPDAREVWYVVTVLYGEPK